MREKLNKMLDPDADLGSPPRMREKLSNNIALATSCGITPAYAGKTLKDPSK